MEALIEKDLNILNIDPKTITDLVDFKGRFIVILKTGNFLIIKRKQSFICSNFSDDPIVQFGPVGKYLLGLSTLGQVYILQLKKHKCDWTRRKLLSNAKTTLLISSAKRNYIWIKTTDNSYLLDSNLRCVFELGFPQNRVYGADLKHYAIINTNNNTIVTYPSGTVFSNVSHVTINRQNQINLISDTNVSHVELVKNQTYYFF